MGMGEVTWTCCHSFVTDKLLTINSGDIMHAGLEMSIYRVVHTLTHIILMKDEANSYCFSYYICLCICIAHFHHANAT
jgi:hypothetical protein